MNLTTSLFRDGTLLYCDQNHALLQKETKNDYIYNHMWCIRCLI